MAEKSEHYLYQNIYNDLKEKIENRTFKPGHRLESELILQKKYAVSRDTIRKALYLLEQEGYLSRTPSKGTFITRPKNDYKLSTMTSFTEQMKARGMIPSSEIESIELSREGYEEIRLKLNIQATEKLYRIVRVRYANNIEMAYEITYIPYKLCPNLQQYLHEKTSLYRIYTGIYGIPLAYGLVSLEAELPKAHIAEKLHLSKKVPVLKMHCIGCSEDDQPIYYVECYYCGDKYVFSTTTIR